MGQITTINDVISTIQSTKSDSIKVISDCEDVAIIEYNKIPITIALTDEAPPRLRFSTNVADYSLEEVSGETFGAILYRLLDLNTEIDPVAAAIDSVDENHIYIQARTTLRVVDLQPSEVICELFGFVGVLGEIKRAIVLEEE